MLKAEKPLIISGGGVSRSGAWNELLEFAEKQKYQNNTPAEGIVVRSMNQTVSFKVVNNKFLLKYGE